MQIGYLRWYSRPLQNEPITFLTILYGLLTLQNKLYNVVKHCDTNDAVIVQWYKEAKIKQNIVKE